MSPSAEPYSENDTRLLHLFKFSPCSVSNFTENMAMLDKYVFDSKSTLTHWRMQDFDWDELTIPRGSSLHGVLGGRGCLDVGSKFYLLISQTLMVPTFRGGGCPPKVWGPDFPRWVQNSTFGQSPTMKSNFHRCVKISKNIKIIVRI